MFCSKIENNILKSSKSQHYFHIRVKAFEAFHWPVITLIVLIVINYLGGIKKWRAYVIFSIFWFLSCLYSVVQNTKYLPLFKFFFFLILYGQQSLHSRVPNKPPNPRLFFMKKLVKPPNLFISKASLKILEVHV